jgi:hypothetical protein
MKKLWHSISAYFPACVGVQIDQLASRSAFIYVFHSSTCPINTSLISVILPGKLVTSFGPNPSEIHRKDVKEKRSCFLTSFCICNFFLYFFLLPTSLNSLLIFILFLHILYIPFSSFIFFSPLLFRFL